MQQLRRSRQFWLVPISWTWLWWKSQRWQRKFNTGHENGDVFVEKNRYLQPEAIYCKLQYHINWISYNIISIEYYISQISCVNIWYLILITDVFWGAIFQKLPSHWGSETEFWQGGILHLALSLLEGRGPLLSPIQSQIIKILDYQKLIYLFVLYLRWLNCSPSSTQVSKPRMGQNPNNSSSS